MHQLPKVHRNCFCRTFLSTFLGQLFEMACYLCMPLHFRIRQCNITREEYIKLDRAALLFANPTGKVHPSIKSAITLIQSNDAIMAPERWERWERVPSQFEIFAATFGQPAAIASEISVKQPK